MSPEAAEQLLRDTWSDSADPAHDIGHIRRVWRTAQAIAAIEGGDLDILVPAAFLHDLINLPKDHQKRSTASRLSADHAVTLLTGKVPEDHLPRIHHAIHAHSWSAQIPPKTLEARILQDADRLDSLGAIGVARCFAVSGALGCALFDPEDPTARRRPLDDQRFSLDHFETKLFRLPEQMTTRTGRNMAADRVKVMRAFRDALVSEAGHTVPET